MKKPMQCMGLAWASASQIYPHSSNVPAPALRLRLHSVSATLPGPGDPFFLSARSSWIPPYKSVIKATRCYDDINGQLILYNSDLSGGSAVSTAAAAGFGSGCQQSDRRRPPDQTHGRYWCGQIFAPAAHRRAAAFLTRRFVSSQPTRRRAAASKINVSSQTPRRIGRNCTVRIVPVVDDIGFVAFVRG